MTESEEKAAFAQAMISANMNPLEAGQLVHPANFNRAAQIASMWHNDAEVKAMIAELKKAEIAETGISLCRERAVCGRMAVTGHRTQRGCHP